MGGSTLAKHYVQRDVRMGAPLLAAIRKAEKLGRGRAITQPLYEKWNAFVADFHHQHTLAADCESYIAANPAITKEISIPR